MLGVEQQGQLDAAVFRHRHVAHVADLAEIGGGADRALVALMDEEADLGAVRPGLAANIAVLNDELEVERTVVDGHEAFAAS